MDLLSPLSVSKPSVISAARLNAGIGSSYGTPLFDYGATSTAAITAGTMALAYGTRPAKTPLTYLVINLTATALAAGESLYVVCYSAGDSLPTTLLWSQAIAAGTSTGALTASSISLRLPSEYFIGVFNPSTNSGTATFTAATPSRGMVLAPSVPSRMGLNISSYSSPPADTSTYVVHSSAQQDKWFPAQYVPLVLARVD